MHSAAVKLNKFVLPCSQVLAVHHGHNADLEALLGCPGPFWGRQYFFWHDEKPLTLIYEVFSPRLGAYLSTDSPVTPG
jgi:chorismate lyase